MLLATVACIALPGCTGDLNRGTGPMGASLPDLSPEFTEADPGTPSERDPEWAWSTIDRRGWETVVIAAPRGQVETNPTPDFTPAVMAGREVDADTYPTAASAVVVKVDGNREAALGAADPLRAAWSLIESPYGLVVRPPWSRVVEPGPTFAILPAPAANPEQPGASD